MTLAVPGVVYAAAVLALAVRVLAYDDNDWLLLLGALTLPWSLAAVLFVWTLIHGGSPAFFWAVFLGGGAINTLLWWRYAPRLLKRRT
jgi:hypothetical protein